MDLEADGLLDVVSRIHVISASYYDSEEERFVVASSPEPSTFFAALKASEGPIVGHNFALFDIPALEKVQKTHIPLDKVVDTLFLSWYLEPTRSRHGIESYGDEFGTEKPTIEDWTNLSYEEYEFRCSQDVKINTMLWHKQLSKLHTLYGGDMRKVKSLIGFLMTKAKAYKMHQDNPLRLDVSGVESSLALLEEKKEQIMEELSAAMPKVKTTGVKSRPQKLFRQDGTLSVRGKAWKELIESRGYVLGYEPDQVEIITGENPPNPGSVPQIKDWLFSLGWEPDYYKDVKDSKAPGGSRQVPQVKDKDGELCKSVLLLAKKEPAILVYEDLGVITHRLGLLKGFLRDHKDGMITASLAGLTNTLRIRHKELVNLPGVRSKYGEHIRTHLLPPEGHVMIGADLSSLEATTRNHFIYDRDRAYVERQQEFLYDPHLDLMVSGGLMDESAAAFYRMFKDYGKNKRSMEEYGRIGELALKYWEVSDAESTDQLLEELDQQRTQAKTTTYSALYGVGAPKLSKELGVSETRARSLLDAYWKVNWAVKAFADSCKWKTDTEGQMWVLNPINGYWYSLRNTKDIFSVVNQSAGDFIFTMWQHFLMQEGVVLHGGFHDEIITSSPEDRVDQTVEKISRAMENVNRVLRLNVPIKFEYKIGKNYGEVH